MKIRIVAFCALAFALSSCATGGGEHRSGRWKAGSDTDKISGTTTRYVSIAVNNAVVPYGDQYSSIAGLHVGCRYVLVQFLSPVGIIGHSSIDIRSGNLPAKTNVMQVDDNPHRVVARGDEANRLISYITSSNTLFVRVVTPSIGKSEVEFNTSGLKEAMSEAGVNCG